jgi:excisionase family DNA binding protein
MTASAVGVTTGQAARYCLVSPDTIVNWIKAENLPAQRTIGGQFRILVEDLRQFMVRNDMSTALLDEELACRPYCWEFRRGARTQSGAPRETCRDCPVFKAKALNCFELRAITNGRRWAHTDCHDCEYFWKWANPRRSE